MKIQFHRQSDHYTNGIDGWLNYTFACKHLSLYPGMSHTYEKISVYRIFCHISSAFRRIGSAFRVTRMSVADWVES